MSFNSSDRNQMPTLTLANEYEKRVGREPPYIDDREKGSTCLERR